jgi:hypothetical protein
LLTANGAGQGQGARQDDLWWSGCCPVADGGAPYSAIWLTAEAL